ncbi:hypothetical protein [Endozoicomonas ascidiicola]|uniref:hypothetical protein n=1 Tax=Endozoicomonas ascidiicola TaxID=1698521 RepID=UPI0008371D01|nr:hypothetical protein [Endozoicomonas ascidiicola]
MSKSSISSIVLGISVLFLSACSTERSCGTNNPVCSSESIPGGWSVAKVTPEARKATEMALVQFSTHLQLLGINQVRTQVVNGTNYALEFTASDGEVLHATVHRSLNDTYSIIKPARRGKLCP